MLHQIRHAWPPPGHPPPPLERLATHDPSSTHTNLPRLPRITRRGTAWRPGASCAAWRRRLCSTACAPQRDSRRQGSEFTGTRVVTQECNPLIGIGAATFHVGHTPPWSQHIHGQLIVFDILRGSRRREESPNEQFRIFSPLLCQLSYPAAPERAFEAGTAGLARPDFRPLFGPAGRVSASPGRAGRQPVSPRIGRGDGQDFPPTVGPTSRRSRRRAPGCFLRAFRSPAG